MEKKKINFTRLVESLRWYEKEYKGSIMDEEDKKTFSLAADVLELAADVLEDLLQSVAEWTAKYEAERDKNMDAVPVTVCASCKYDGKCMFQSFVIENSQDDVPYDRNTFYCADGERKDGERRTDGK